jgi:glycosyltransferase involved in cell wall biosynthesis
MELKASIINQYFDHVYVINLEKRPDRKITMLQKLSRLGIKADFVQAINGYSNQNIREHQHYLEQPIGGKDSHKLEIEFQRKLVKSPGAWGYLKTYCGILQDAKRRGFERILCFDDDVIFHKDFENQFKKAVHTIPEEWKLLYLGASQYVWKIPQGLNYQDANKKAVDNSEPFYHPKNTDGSFAIGIHESVFDLLIRTTLKMNCPFDSGPLRSVIEAHPKNCYVLAPNIVIADVSESDIREGQDQKILAEQLKWDMADYDFPNSQDLVSIIMPAFNAEKTIEKSIRSILMQSYRSLELIVVDDASSDNTAQIVEKLIKEDSRVQIISLTTNKGVGHARNEGIKASKGKIIAFQDADDISLKGRLAYQLIPIYEKGVLFTVCRFYRSRCTIEELDINDQVASMELVESRRIKNKAGYYEYRDKADIGLVTIMYKRSAFEDYGLFEEHRFGEDMELLERILFYKNNKVLDENYNGHSFLSHNNSITNTYSRIEMPLYISPEMDENNLTVQYQENKRANLAAEHAFRKKYKSGGLEQYATLSKSTAQAISPFLKYNSLKLDSFVMLPEVDYQILLSHTNNIIESEKMQPSVMEIQNSISWKITAPLRWIASKITS